MLEAGQSGSNNVDCSVHSPFLHWTVQLVPSFAPQDDIPAPPCARPLWLAWSQRPVPLSTSVHPDGLDWTARSAREGPWPSVLRNISRCPQDPTPTRGAGGGPNPHEGRVRELALRVPVYQARDMSTRCIRSSRSRPPCGVCPLERVGEQRATCCSPQQSSCRLGSRLTRRLETSPLISSLARGSLGGQASWPRGPDTVLSIQFLVCLWWFLAHTRAAGPCHCRLALSSLCSVLHSPRFRPVFVRFVPWRKGGLPLLPLAVPSDFLPSAPHA